MENDALKSAWQHIRTPRKSSTDLKSAMEEGNHPVLKGIRRQLLFETIGFTLFLLVYYDFFDGDRKPLYANLLLAGAMLLVIGHNIAGYRLAGRGVKDSSIRRSLEERLSRIKTYAVISVTSRVLIMACVCIFFISVVTLDTQRYRLLALIAVVFAIQITLLSRLWRRRIRRLKEVIADF
ncbi:MAG: hypothetical protein ABS46_00870 [Cytophagaceae bacterium SCN 52-12]|nr:MAG: hypothetical protein ABS46_00870 [Cytophagaceae bacterium SCN 52-12]